MQSQPLHGLADCETLRAMSKIGESNRSGWYAKKCKSLDEMRTEGIRFWQQQGGSSIRKAAWELVVENWKVKDKNSDELRFQRSSPLVREE